MHQMKVRGPLDPLWFNKVRHGSWHSARVLSPDSVYVEGGVLFLARPEEIQLSSDDTVQVRFSGSNFFLETGAECGVRLERVYDEARSRAQKERARLDTLRDEALAFNAGLHIPVEWVPGFKDVLSGLSENSNGDGRNRATVVHIYLLADLKEGRLTRDAEHFLCSLERGKQWHNGFDAPASVSYDGAGREYQDRITCQACLKIAARWNTTEKEEREQ